MLAEHTLSRTHSIGSAKHPPFFLGAVIWSPCFKHDDHGSKHDKASQSITLIYLGNNQIGDDGAKALADAVKAILVRWF